MNQQEYIQSWFARNEQRGDQELKFGELSLVVRKGVFCPDPTLTNSSTQTIEHLPDVTNKRVLDLGTGSGLLALIAAHRGAKEVVAVDIDPAAIANAIENCRRLGFEKIVSIVQGDLFDAVLGQFDVIIAALPILDSAWEGRGISVKDTFNRFFRGLDEHLSPGGTVLFNFASFGDRESLNKALVGCSRHWKVYEEEKFGVTWQIFVTGPDNT